jgi:class 3 adenylate cyclase
VVEGGWADDPEGVARRISEFVNAGTEAAQVAREQPAPPEPGRSRLVTVLFTDLVSHSEMMSRLGDERGRTVLREHERITREVLKANGGTEVKTMGDGFMASFGSVTKAVECAIALQRAFAEREGEPLSVRVGLNAGEPIEEDGKLFGATVILASRIAAKAEGGEILVADTVRGLCSGKGFLFADRGEFVAKGFEEPVRVYEVRWRE